MLEYSAHARQQQHLLSPTDLWVMALEVIHPALPLNVRLVVDTEPLVHLDQIYSPMSASIQLPADNEGDRPSVTLTMDNVGRTMMRIVEDTHGLHGAKVRMMQIYRSRPDIVEQERTLDMQDIKATQNSFSATLTYDNVLDLPSVPLTYRPSTKPSLF
jgi:hypothetical protein